MKLTEAEMEVLLFSHDRLFRIGDRVTHVNTQGRYVITGVALDADTETLSVRYTYMQEDTLLVFSRSQAQMEDGRFVRTAS